MINNCSLYIKNKDVKLIAEPTDEESDVTVKHHLNTGPSGSCSRRTKKMCVEVYFQLLSQVSITTFYHWFISKALGHIICSRPVLCFLILVTKKNTVWKRAHSYVKLRKRNFSHFNYVFFLLRQLCRKKYWRYFNTFTIITIKSS